MAKAQSSRRGYGEIFGLREKWEADGERLFKLKEFRGHWGAMQGDDLMGFSFRKIILAVEQSMD